MTKHDAHDALDFIGLTVPLTFDGVKVTPWGMGGIIGQDSFKDIEIFDRPISLQRGDIIVLMSDGLYELIPWKEIEDVLSGGQDCQSKAYALMEKGNQNAAEDRENASVILLRWDGSTT